MSDDEDDAASVVSSLSNAAKRRAKRVKKAAREAQSIPLASGGSGGEGNLTAAASVPRAPSTSSTLGSFQVADAILQSNVVSRSPSVASTGRSWEHVPSETSTMRQGPYSPAPKAKAQASASSSSAATPSTAVVATGTLISMFGPSKAEELYETAVTVSDADPNFAYWILFLSIALTMLLIYLGYIIMFRRSSAGSSLNIRPFISRLIRRCRAIPNIISFKTFEDMDALQDAVDKLTQEIESARRKQETLIDEAAEEKIRWINIAENQAQRLLAAEKDATEIHITRPLRWPLKPKSSGRNNVTFLPTTQSGSAAFQMRTAREDPTLLTSTIMVAHALRLPWMVLGLTNAIRVTHASLQRIIHPMHGVHSVTVSPL